MYLILLGAPGSGKGTQAAYLSEDLALAHIATGDLFREAQEKATPLGLEAKAYMERGKLVPDDITVRMLLERLGSSDCEKGAILDGFPRTMDQAKALDGAFEETHNDIDAVLHVNVSEEELVRRLSGRRICQDCQAPYHLVSSPPKAAGVCDKCGGQLYQRPDDSEETVRNRLQVYGEQTSPLVDYYVNCNKLLEIDGEQLIQSVRKDTLAALKMRVGER